MVGAVAVPASSSPLTVTSPDSASMEFELPAGVLYSNPAFNPAKARVADHVDKLAWISGVNSCPSSSSERHSSCSNVKSEPTFDQNSSPRLAAALLKSQGRTSRSSSVDIAPVISATPAGVSLGDNAHCIRRAVRSIRNTASSKKFVLMSSEKLPSAPPSVERRRSATGSSSSPRPPRNRRERMTELSGLLSPCWVSNSSSAVASVRREWRAF